MTSIIDFSSIKRLKKRRVENGDKSCRFLHKFGGWKDTDSGNLMENNRRYGKFIYQERRCLRCNAVQLRRVLSVDVSFS